MTPSNLADTVLPLIRTHRELRWAAANEHGRQMHEAVDLLEQAIATEDPETVFAVTQKAIRSAIKVIVRADDSSGIVGHACARLLDLHPTAAAAARVPVANLIDWMMNFQFEGEVDYFELDPVAYAPALGEAGLARYRAKLAEVADRLGPEPPESPHSHARWVLESNRRRLAVLDHDIEAIIRTHAGDRSVPAWLEDTAKAFEEIGEIDLAIDWARQATELGAGHQSLQAGTYWCDLLAEHRPQELLDARLAVFRRWPKNSTASQVHHDAGAKWAEYQADVIERLATSPRDAVLFALLTLNDVQLAWDQAHSLGLEDADTWDKLATTYGKFDPLAPLPVLKELVENELHHADAYRYQVAARRLKKMRRLAADSEKLTDVDDFIAELRETYRRRSRLQLEFDRAGLPSRSLRKNGL